MARTRRAALDMLARREHSCRELMSKLLSKGFEHALVEQVVAALVHERLVSDERFVEMLLNARRQRGAGPLRIRKELQEKGVTEELIARSLDMSGAEWIEQVQRVREKKFGEALPQDYAERARQARFLHYRGFTHDQITRALGGDDRD